MLYELLRLLIPLVILRIGVEDRIDLVSHRQITAIPTWHIAVIAKEPGGVDLGGRRIIKKKILLDILYK